MKWLDKLPGAHRSRHGLEWVLWKRLPSVLGWGTALPLVVAALIWRWPPSHTELSSADADRLLLVYQLVGLVMFHWTLVLTVAIGCCIVMLMKGPAYVADSYPPSERDGQI